MKNIWLVAAICLIMATNIHNAAAFSTDQKDSVNTDGSVKYADPDEQMPGFMVAPDNGAAMSNSLSSGAPSVTMPAVGENDNGARAFDRAFSHQQDKE
jgi:hypothetical protein